MRPRLWRTIARPRFRTPAYDFDACFKEYRGFVKAVRGSVPEAKCFGGGKPGVSNAFASTSWGADYMPHCACAGYAAVNLHSGGDGYYTPIAVGRNPVRRVAPLVLWDAVCKSVCRQAAV